MNDRHNNKFRSFAVWQFSNPVQKKFPSTRSNDPLPRRLPKLVSMERILSGICVISNLRILSLVALVLVPQMAIAQSSLGCFSLSSIPTTPLISDSMTPTLCFNSCSDSPYVLIAPTLKNQYKFWCSCASQLPTTPASMSCSEKCPGVSIPAQAPPCGGFRDGVIAWSVYKNTQAGTASPAPVPQAQPAISKIMAAVQQPQPQRQTQQFPQQGTQQQTTEQQTTQQGTQPSQQSQQQQQQQQSQQPDQQQPQQQQESSSQQQGAQEPGGNNQTVQQPASSNGAPNNQKSIFQMVENNVNASNQQTSSSLVIQSTSTTSVNSAFAAITITSLSPTAKGTGNRAEIASSDPDRDGDVDDKPTLKAMPTLAASSTDIHPVIAAHVIAGIAFACLVLVVGIALMYRRRLGANILPSVLPIAELDRKEDAGDVKSVARMYTVRKDDIESVLPTAGEIRPPSPTLERSKGTLDYYRFGSPNSGVTLKSAEDDHFSRKISVGKSSDSSANKSVPTLGVLRKDLAVRDSDLYSVRSGSSSASQNIASKSLSLARSTSLAKVPEGKVTPRSSRAKRSTNNSNRWNSRMRSFEVSRASYQSSSAPLSPASMYNRRIRASTTAKSESGRSSTTSRAPSSLFMNVLAYNLAQNAKAEDEARANRRSFPDDDVKENRRC